MPLSHDEQLAILLADHRRFQTRQDREDAILSHDSESRAGLADWSCERPILRGTGVIPLNPAKTKTPRRQPRTRVVGVAAPSDNPEHIARLAAADVEPTVRITRNGKSSIVTVASLRGQREKRGPVSSTPAQKVDTARFNTGHNFND